ncbi:MFS general substrate transporter [Dothidotthia symphoricarpi CBS 119687]|uniref:MFS general substrate transporter n=1 Tax=Dothidotthia symphoricarpi CBS 119687 TaxID=1392245 RepID=A0A6A6AHJ5_9PLEO|nr:MFS general substrate transporter [Dothidotthia symphoricarpi CBS 119687]KAF2131026.1 MFS general substrate transporter [Dothidotthia symphoricarpi CBS 119687]
MGSILRDGREREDEALIPHADSTADNIVTFQLNDPEDPRNWASARKWIMIAAIIPIDLSVSWGASGFSPVAGDFARDMHVSTQVATLGLSMYVLGLAFGPMTLAPLSEYFGRRPVYIYSYGIFLGALLWTSYVKSLGLFFVLRFCSGYFASTTISNFGGTIADLFEHTDTGPAMSIFIWAATGGSPTGFVLFSFIAHGRSWQAVFRVMFFVCLSFWVILVVALYTIGETRQSVLLLRRAEMLRKSTGEDGLDVPDEYKQRGPKHLFGTALARPFQFLWSEAIVQFGALYNGFLYGLSFLFNGAFHIIFGPGGYGFGTIQIGICFLGLVVGISVGLFSNRFQEKHYQRQIARAGRDVPEARVYQGKLAAVVLPASLLAFAFSATPKVHPFVPVLASAFTGYSFYTLITMSLTYTTDAYKTYSASALAGIGLIRNLAGAAFPLVGRSLFLRVGSRNASLVLAAIAVLLAPIPFVLEKRGASLRKRSPWAVAHEDDESEINTS